MLDIILNLAQKFKIRGIDMKKFCILLMCIIVLISGCKFNSVTSSGKDIENKKSAVVEKNTESTENVGDFELYLEAEDNAAVTGNVRKENSVKGYSGSGYLDGLENDDDTISFNVRIPKDDFYDIDFISASYDGYKENNVYLDGDLIGVSKVTGTEFQDSVLKRIFLRAGQHVIKMTKSWGWIRLDALKITKSKRFDESIYKVSNKLVDPKATESTRKLMQYLVDMYGKKIISGQYADKGINSPEFQAIKQATGKMPAILGLDFIDYTPSRVAHGTVGKSVDYAIEFNKLGGIVTFCWHWNAPEPYLYNTESEPWWKGFYTEGTNINLEAIMDGRDKKGYELLLQDIDVIANQLKRLQDADVPVLWRPLHEASGGWFWWGASGPDAYIKLYRLLFDRLTSVYGIHNLIWVWNGQDPKWYPGDQYVDIIGIDIYPGERVYNSQSAKFNEILEWTKSKKIIAMSENGCLFDPDLAFRDDAKWSYFGTWSGEFVTLNNTNTLSEKYTEKYMFQKVYNSDKVITLDELPNLKKYGDNK